MSQKERTRLKILNLVKRGVVRLADAAGPMDVGYRQAKRIWRRYREEGDAGLVHRNRGRISNRRRPDPLRRAVLGTYKERYAGFGPTLACEHLARSEGLLIDHETLRRWLLAEGLWSRHRRRSRHRSWRERRAQQGELVQMDGSDHKWFEDRGPRLVLMVLIDDATNYTYARFYAGETTGAAFEVFGRYIRRKGIPRALYVDRDSIYRADRQGRVDEELRDEPLTTQFGRAMRTLGVELKLANSPQAKGRVERRNGLLQDRLVKELRLRKIQDMEAANTYLETVFLPDLNRRFVVPAREAGSAYRPVPEGLRLEEVLCWQDERRVQNDWTVRWRNRWFQITARHQGLNLPGKQVTVREQLNRKVSLLWRGERLQFRELASRPAHAPVPKPQSQRPRVHHTPSAEHPWRQAACRSQLIRIARLGRRATATPPPACPSQKGTFLTSS